jgi:hypothetical protein
MDCKKGPECSLFKNDKVNAFYQPPFHFTVYTCHDNINNSINNAVNRAVQKNTVICSLLIFLEPFKSPLSEIDFCIVSYIQRTRFTNYFRIVSY